MQLGMMGVDPDDHLYRRLTNGSRLATRDLSPLSHDRQLEVAWYLFEKNPFAQRLITLMTDLVIGEGAQVTVEADDNRIREVIDRFWSRNQLAAMLREFHIARMLNGELVLPVGINPFTGLPVLGYLDSMQVRSVVPLPENVLVRDKLILKGQNGQADQELRVIRENPATGKLEGEVHFHRINGLPNSLRGRSSLMPSADWLDLYDQFMFAEIERLNLISSFAWDYTIEDADDKKIKEKLRAMPRMKPGAVFGHNQHEKLEARTPDLKASDRSEVARMLRVHIVGAFGFPETYFGTTDSNNATIQGQNDVMMKTPAAIQREFGGFLSQMVRHAIESSLGMNPALFRDASPMYRITMPEIAAKDIARVGTTLASVMTAMDTGIANETVSKRLAVKVTAAMVGRLGVDVEPDALLEEIQAEKDEREDLSDLLHAELARRGSQNPPVPADPDGNEQPDEPAGSE